MVKGKRYPYLVLKKDGKVQDYAYASAFFGQAAYDWSCETSIYLNHIVLSVPDPSVQKSGAMMEIPFLGNCIGPSPLGAA